MKRRLFRSVLAVLVLCLALLGFAACSKGKSSGGGPEAVQADTIKVSETADGIVLTWGAVPSATGYRVTCNNVTVETESRAINWVGRSDFTLPDDMVFNFKIVAVKGGSSSAATDYTFTAKGVALNVPAISSFDDGVLEWNAVANASAYKVTVNGQNVSDNNDGYFHAKRLDLSTYAGQALKVEISAIGSNVKYYKMSNALVINIDSEHKKIVMTPITEYTVKDSVLSWGATSGAAAYNVYDIFMDVVATVKEGEKLEYDMTGKNLVYGVYPVAKLPFMSDAPVEPVAIPYLTGDGTTESPYVIKTPFDLRAIDYYEAYYDHIKASKLVKPNNYVIQNDIDYATVAALQTESNIYTLRMPFYGTLDGGSKKLSNIRVIYDGGYWSLFDFLVKGSTVKNIVFENPEISNEPKKADVPIKASIATVADRSYGTISGIAVNNAKYTAAGGEVSGICTHNYGEISGCTVSGEFKQGLTGQAGQACYEMAGIALENYGKVLTNTVSTLTITGSQATGDNKTSKYFNVRTAGGIVAVNRTKGEVKDNTYGTIDMIGMVDAYEYGGLAAYNAPGGKVTQGKGTIGTLTWSKTAKKGSKVTANKGSSEPYVGKLIGKDEG